MGNINDSYFDGYYKDIWRKVIPEQLTVKEVDFMVSYFDLKPGSKVLDLMCGYGRHAIALARKGIEVTAVDNLGDYITEINLVAQNDNLPIKAIKSNVIEFKTNELFDLAICMGNSLNFFNPEETRHLLANIFSHLRFRGMLLINSWSLSEIVKLSYIESNEAEFDGMKFINQSKQYTQPNRVETQSTVIAPDGTVEIKKAIDYIFSISEMEEMLNKTGFKLKEIFSIPGRKKFTEGDPRAYLIAEK